MADRPNTIAVRLAIEGAQDILKQLNDLGKQGAEAAKELESAFAATNGTLGTFGRTIDTIASGVKEAAGRFKEAAGLFGAEFKLGSFQDTLGDLTTSLTNVIKKISELVLGVAAAATGFAFFVKSAASAAAEIKHVSESVGLSVEAFQQLSFAAATVGIEQEKFTKAIRIFSKNIVEAAGEQADAFRKYEQSLGIVSVGILDAFTNIGGGAAKMRDQLANTGVRVIQSGAQFEDLRVKLVDMGVRFADTWLNVGKGAKPLEGAALQMQNLGIRLNDLKGNLRPTEDILLDLAEKFKQLGEGPKAVALAVQLFGKSGNALLPLLLKGKDGVKELILAFDGLGISISKAQTVTGHDLESAFTRLFAVTSGVKNQVGLIFAPHVTALVNALTKALSDNIGTIKKFAEALAKEAKPIVDDLVRIIEGKEPKDERVKAWKKSFEDFVTSVRTFVNGTLIPAFTKFMATLDKVAIEINKAFGTKLTGNSLAILLVVGQVIGVFDLLGKTALFVAATVVAVAGAFKLLGGTAILGALVKGLAFVAGWFVALIATITGFPLIVAGAIVVGLIALVALIVVYWDKVKAAWNTVVDFVIKKAAGMWAALKDMWATFTSDLSAAWETIKNGGAAAFEWVRQKASAAWAAIKAIFAGAGDVLSAVWAAIRAGAAAAWAWVLEKASTAWEGVKALFAGAGDLLAGVWNAIIAGATAAWSWVLQKATAAWDGVKALFAGAGDILASTWAAITAGAAAAWESVKTAASTAWEGVKALFTGTGDLLSDVWTAITEGATATWEWVLEKATAGWEGVKALFSGAGDLLSAAWEAIKTGADGAWTSIKDGARSAWEGIKSAFSGGDGLAALWTGIKNGASSAWSFVVEGASTVLAKISAALAPLVSAVTAPLRSVVDSVSGIFSSVVDSAKELASSISRVTTAGFDLTKFIEVGAALAAPFISADATIRTLLDGLAQFVASIGVQFSTSFGTSFDSLTSAATSFASSISGVFESMVSTVSTAASQISSLVAQIVSSAQQAASATAGLNTGGLALAAGGPVWGAGTSTSDSIDARLSRGEFVHPTRAVAYYGMKFMEDIRHLRLPKLGFKLGGLVGAIPRLVFPATASFARLAAPPIQHFRDGGPVGSLSAGGFNFSGRPIMIPAGDGGPPVRGIIPEDGARRLEREVIRGQYTSAHKYRNG